MIEVSGVRVPDQHFADQVQKGPLYEGRGTYRWAKFEAAVRYCPEGRRRHAVDVGAHVGLWSWPLSFEFERVTAFEPVERFANLFEWNLAKRDNVELHRAGLAQRPGWGAIIIADSGEGTARLTGLGERKYTESAKMVRLDEAGLSDIDFLKISCEGAEHFVLLGGEETIRRDRPIIAIEQKRKRMAAYGLSQDEGIRLLEKWGAETVSNIEGDWVMTWPE